MSTIALQSKENDEVTQWVTFTLENEIYGINVLKVQEIQRHSDISPIPGTSQHVLGMLNLRGEVICVIDTRAKFGLPAFDITDSSRIIILETEKSVIGLLVDGVDEVVNIKCSEMDDAPNVGSNESAPFIKNVCRRAQKLLILLDVDKVLTEPEWQEISQL